MARLSKAQERARTELRAAAQREGPPERIAAEMIGALQRAIGWDGFRLFGVDTRTLLINRLLAASDNDGWARREWLQEVYLDDSALPYIQLPSILRSGLKSVAYQERQELSWGYPSEMLQLASPEHHYHYFHESRSPTGGVLMAGFGAQGQWIAALQAYRRDPGSPFRPGDVDFLRRAGSLIGPTLSRALHRERFERTAAASNADLPQASGVALVNSDGKVLFVTPAGAEWMERLGAGDRERSGLLPTALWSAMLGLRHIRGEAGSHVVNATVSGVPITVEASPGPGDGSVAIVISEVQRPGPPSVPETWPLTDQQRAIVLQIVSGLTNQEIAEALFISENTVEWHVRQIFNKLDVRSRTELTARYFRESMLGSYHDPDLTSDE